MEDRIPEIAAGLQKAVEVAVAAGAEKVAESARNRVPYREGYLYDAIHTTPDPDGLGVQVIAGGKVAGDTNVFYAHMVEHGTSHSAPRPFLLPALEENTADIIAMVDEAIKGVVK